MTKTDLLATKPTWAKAALVAVYETDQCDGMTDYYATRTERVVFLGWSKTDRDMFAEMRSAAARFPETADLATAGTSAEHREKYSMGAGYYLKAGYRYSTGWLVRKVGDWYFPGTVEVLDATQAPVATPKPSASVPEPSAVAGVTLTLNAEKNGVELRFPAKPADAVRDSLKAHGWRWSRFSGCWYHRDTPDARTFAATLVG